MITKKDGFSQTEPELCGKYVKSDGDDFSEKFKSKINVWNFGEKNEHSYEDGAGVIKTKSQIETTEFPGKTWSTLRQLNTNCVENIKSVMETALVQHLGQRTYA